MASDDPQLPELTRRQEEILSLIVHAYTENPEPVSSKYLVETYNLNFSSATIRNEMAALEELGYIAAPHKSAGRVPTGKGYRYFVKRLLRTNELAAPERTYIADRLQATPLATEQWMRVAASLLARTAQTAALVTPPISETNRYKHLELIAIQGRLVLMVLVLDSGAVHQQMLNLAEPVLQQRLSEVAERINARCAGLTAKEVRLKSVQLPLLEREIGELVADLMLRADSNQARMVYRDGLSDVLDVFQSQRGAQQVVRVFEERAFLNMIFADILSPFINNVQVVIAGDERWEELSHLSMVLSRYGIPGHLSGAVGVLGPTHIDYARAISAVRYVSTLMSDMLVDLYESGDNPRLENGAGDEE